MKRQIRKVRVKPGFTTRLTLQLEGGETFEEEEFSRFTHGVDMFHYSENLHVHLLIYYNQEMNEYHCTVYNALNDKWNSRYEPKVVIEL